MATYTVVSGDNLSKIAAANGVTVAQLIEWNPQYAANPDLIHVGDVVNIGSGGGTGAQITAADVIGWFDEYGADIGFETDETPEARAQRIADSINNGERTVEDVRNSISMIPGRGGVGTGTQITADDVIGWFEDVGADIGFESDVAPEVRAQRIADEINSGTRTVEDVKNSISMLVGRGGTTGEIPADKLPGTEKVGAGDTFTVIPSDMRLVRVTDPAGTDASDIYYLVGTVYGVDVAYEVGPIQEIIAQFGGLEAFSNITSMTQAQFDGGDITVVGMVDEIAGATGSLQSQYDRDMRAAGLEAPPQWLQDDRRAMVKYVTGINEGWSGERMWTELSTTDGFKTRFEGIETVMSQLGTTSWVRSVTEYVRRENDIRSSILSSRGPGADTSPEYVSSLIASGWQPAEVGELLALEKRVRDNPEAIDNINDILVFQGLDPLEPDDFVSFLQDQDALTIDPSYAPGQVFEAVNDALRFQALLDEGLTISHEFATSLGEDTSDMISAAGTYSERARIAAIEASRNANELEWAKYGLDKNDIIAATFGEESPTGKTTSQVNELLEKMGRERAKASTGFSSSSAYTDALGRLRVQGLANL